MYLLSLVVPRQVCSWVARAEQFREDTAHVREGTESTPKRQRFVLDPSVPHHYRNITIAAGGAITTRTWDGKDGGVLRLNAAGLVSRNSQRLYCTSVSCRHILQIHIGDAPDEPVFSTHESVQFLWRMLGAPFRWTETLYPYAEAPTFYLLLRDVFIQCLLGRDSGDEELFTARSSGPNDSDFIHDIAALALRVWKARAPGGRIIVLKISHGMANRKKTSSCA